MSAFYFRSLVLHPFPLQKFPSVSFPSVYRDSARRALARRPNYHKCQSVGPGSRLARGTNNDLLEFPLRVRPSKAMARNESLTLVPRRAQGMSAMRSVRHVPYRAVIRPRSILFASLVSRLGSYHCLSMTRPATHIHQEASPTKRTMYKATFVSRIHFRKFSSTLIVLLYPAETPLEHRRTQLFRDADGACSSPRSIWPRLGPKCYPSTFLSHAGVDLLAS